MSNFFKMKTKNPVFEELKRVNPLVTVGIIDCGEKVSCSLRRRNNNTNKHYNVHLDNEINTMLDIPFLEIMDNRNIIQMGTCVLLGDELDGKACDYLVDLWGLNSLYTILSSIINCTDSNYSLESIQNVIDSIVEYKVNLTEHQLFTVRNLINYGIIARCPIGVVGDLIIVLNDLFQGCCSWSERTSTRLFK